MKRMQNGRTCGVVLGRGHVLAALLAMAAGGCDSNDAVSTSDYTNVGDVVVDGAGGDAISGVDGAGGGDGTALNDSTELTDAAGADGSLTGSDATTPDDAIAGTDANSTADVAPAKYPTCSTLLQCAASACVGTNWAPGCGQICADNASPTAKEQWTPFATCLETQCAKGLCAGSSDPACMGSCVGQKCLTKLAMCGSDGKSGKSGCASYYTCVDKCKGAGLNCAPDCYAALTTAAQGLLQNVDACTTAAGASDAFSACPQQVLTCLANGDTGPANCEDTWACTAGCTGTEAEKTLCTGKCYGGGTSAAQGKFAQVIACESSPTKANCPDAYVGCLNPTGSKTCIAALGCYGTCTQTDAVARTKCIFGCLDSASPAEVKKAVVYGNCTDTCNCKGDKACEATCNTTTCKAQFDACQGL